MSIGSINFAAEQTYPLFLGIYKQINIIRIPHIAECLLIYTDSMLLEIKRYVESQLASNPIDIIISHTCPFKYEPIEMFLSGIDQSTVDTSTEHWLDQIEESTDYKAWYCGHWHVDKRVDKMHFLFHSIETAKL